MTTPRHPTIPSPEQIRAGWDAIADGFDEHLTPLNMAHGEQVLRRAGLTAGTRFLDIAAGSGALAIPAARAGARVVATDISPAMVERLTSRARAEGLDTLDARVMDGQALQFDDDSFDVAASQHGVSLFPDIDRGLGEMVRVTRPGGRVIIVAFGPPPQVEFLTFFLGALRAAIPGFTGPPMDPPPLPFQVADPDLLRSKLTTAGLADVAVDTVVWDLPVRSASHLWQVVTTSNPIGAQLVVGLGQAQVDDTRRVLDGMLRERSGGGPGAVLHTRINIGIGTA